MQQRVLGGPGSSPAPRDRARPRAYARPTSDGQPSYRGGERVQTVRRLLARPVERGHLLLELREALCVNGPLADPPGTRGPSTCQLVCTLPDGLQHEGMARRRLAHILHDLAHFPARRGAILTRPPDGGAALTLEVTGNCADHEVEAVVYLDEQLVSLVLVHSRNQGAREVSHLDLVGEIGLHL